MLKCKVKPYTYIRRRVSSVVEHSSANPKVPGLILDLVSYQGHVAVHLTIHVAIHEAIHVTIHEAIHVAM